MIFEIISALKALKLAVIGLGFVVGWLTIGTVENAKAIERLEDAPRVLATMDTPTWQEFPADEREGFVAMLRWQYLDRHKRCAAVSVWAQDGDGVTVFYGECAEKRQEV